jgi:hypothetical protein
VAVPIKIFCKSVGTVETITDKQNNVSVTYCTTKRYNDMKTLKNSEGKILIRIFLRYQRSNQNPYIEEEQKTQWPSEKVQKDKQ